MQTRSGGEAQAALPSRTLSPDDYVELWIYFSTRADALKDRRWSVATWFIAIVGGILAYLIEKPIVAFDRGALAIRDPESLILLVAIGLVISLFNLAIILNFTRQIRANRDTAIDLAGQIVGLKEILDRVNHRR